MDDDFTEFRSAGYVAEADLLGLSSSSSLIKRQQSDESYSSSFIFNSSSEGLPRPPSIKKKTFVFPYDLDLNATNLLEIATNETTKKPTPWSLMEDIEGLNKLAKELATNGRLNHSLRCKKHAEIVGEMMRIKEIKRIATERADYDTAIQYRNLLGQLEKQLSNATEIEEWLKDHKETTLIDLENKVRKAMGEEAALEFKDKFVFPDIKKSSDIENAQAIMISAQHYINVKTILKDQVSVFFQQTHQILQKISEELSKAITIFYKLKPHLAVLSEDSELQIYIKALPEVYFISLRLSKVISYCNSTRAFEKILYEISQNWDECKDFLNSNVPDFKNECNENVCGLCLFGCKNLVLLCGGYFHVACINFWINRISTDPPKLITEMLYAS